MKFKANFNQGFRIFTASIDNTVKIRNPALAFLFHSPYNKKVYTKP